MEARELVPLLSGISADAVDAAVSMYAGVAGAFTTIALDKLLRRRAEVARGILLDELRVGQISLVEIDDDDAAAITLRYLRAATEGAARLNLRLLGACIAGQAKKDSLHADEFLRWADVLASLRPEEVKLMAIIQRVGLTDQEAEEGVLWKDVAQIAAIELGFPVQEVNGIASALMRTGCLHGRSGWGAFVFEPTRVFGELVALVDIEGATNRAEADQASTSSQ